MLGVLCGSENRQRAVLCTEMGKVGVLLLVWEKDMQFLIITVALLTQKDVTMAHCTYVQSR